MKRGLPFLLCLWGVGAEPVAQVNVRVPMRDGVRLAANVFRPAVQGRFPVVLNRTPYGRAAVLTPNLRYFIDHGYAVVSQDVRGRYDSEGVFDPVVQEMADGEDTINWIARQSWCDGNVGMFGGSYLGIAQWRAALAAPAALKAIIPVVAGGDEYRDRYYSLGGAFKLGHRLQWMTENLRVPGFAMPDFRRIVDHLPLRSSDQAATGRTVGFYQQVLDHPAYDEWWRAVSTLENLDKVKVPAMIVGGWYDNYVDSDWAVFAGMRARGRPARIIVGPWGHNMSLPMPEVDFGPQAQIPLRQIETEWFDRWLKPASPQNPFPGPAVRYFAMGDNAWRNGDTWPPAGLRPTAMYLSAEGTLLPRVPRKEARQQFQYNPRFPVPTRGGAVCCNPRVFPWGPLDQRPVENRPDVLLFTSGEIKEPLEIAGTVQTILFVASSAPDTDFTAKLTDVGPDGRSQLLCDGLLRLRYRKSLEKPETLPPGSVERITIQTGTTGHVFLTGHRIRLAISSSNFPRFDRNPNDGLAVANAKEWRVATQVVLSGPQHGSHVLLPVVPRP